MGWQNRHKSDLPDAASPVRIVQRVETWCKTSCQEYKLGQMTITQLADVAIFGFGSAAGLGGAIAAAVRAWRGIASVFSLAVSSAIGGAVGGGVVTSLFLFLTDAPRDAIVSGPLGLVLGGLVGVAPGLVFGLPVGLAVLWFRNRARRGPPPP